MMIHEPPRQTPIVFEADSKLICAWLALDGDCPVADVDTNMRRQALSAHGAVIITGERLH